MNRKELIVIILSLIISIVTGIISNDLIIGGSILLTALLCEYYACEGKRINYIYGLINYLLMAYVAFENNLFGIFMFYILIFSPLQIKGYVAWNKNLNHDKNVKVREFTLKNSIIITFLCIIGSVILGYLLTLIPTQRLAFMDATSNCINLCGEILMILRFKESWWVWLVNNIIDLVIWAITAINGGSGSIMMLIVSIVFLVMNFYGIAMWNVKAKRS